MALNITTSTTNGVVVVSLRGVIYFGKESASLRLLVKDLSHKSHQIVLDLKEVTHIDSGGLGTLVGLYASVRKVGGDLKLANLDNHAHELLQITKLVTVFEVFENAEDAIASFDRLRLRRNYQRRKAIRTMNARLLAGAKCFGVEVIEDLEL